MKAIICPRYGAPDVLEVADIPTPPLKVGEVLVAIHATAATSADARIRSATFPPGMGALARLALGWNGPRQPVLGGVFAGAVAEVGTGVSTFAPGDRVFGMTGARMGCYATHQTVKATGAIAALSDAIDYADAAALPFGFTTAYSFLKQKGDIKSGETLMVIGASGEVGCAAVQIGKICGAEVAGVCSAVNADTVRGLGADAVIDYQIQDPCDGTSTYDVVLDTQGKTPVKHLLKAVKPGGRLLLCAAGLRDMLRRSGGDGRKIISGVAAERAADLARVAEWTVAGTYLPVIDSTFSLSGIAEAHARVGSGRKVGTVVVTVT